MSGLKLPAKLPARGGLKPGMASVPTKADCTWLETEQHSTVGREPACHNASLLQKRCELGVSRADGVPSRKQLRDAEPHRSLSLTRRQPPRPLEMACPVPSIRVPWPVLFTLLLADPLALRRLRGALVSSSNRAQTHPPDSRILWQRPRGGGGAGMDTFTNVTAHVICENHVSVELSDRDLDGENHHGLYTTCPCRVSRCSHREVPWL